MGKSRRFERSVAAIDNCCYKCYNLGIMNISKKLLIPVASVVLLSGIVAGGITLNKTGASSEPPIVQQVQHQGEVLDNHEARITNAENNITDLQNKTNTPSSTNNTQPPAVVTPAAAPSVTPDQTPAPTPTPVTLTTFAKIPLANSQDVDCSVVYTDGTSYQWHWMTVNGAIGHTFGNCDQTLVGTTKLN